MVQKNCIPWPREELLTKILVSRTNLEGKKKKKISASLTLLDCQVIFCRRIVAPNYLVLPPSSFLKGRLNSRTLVLKASTVLYLRS